MAGNLDVDLLMANDSGTYESIADEDGAIFGGAGALIAQDNNADTLWEPGKTQIAYFAIENKGNLDLKYQVSLKVNNPTDGKDLYEVMQYQILPDEVFTGKQDLIAKRLDCDDFKPITSVGTHTVSNGEGHLSRQDDASNKDIHYFALAVHMDENAGNEYMNGQVEFDLTVLATQDTVESDSFNNQYDANAPYEKDLATFNFTNTDEALAFCPTCFTAGNTDNHDATHVDYNFKVEDGKAVITGNTAYIGQADLDWEANNYIIAFTADFSDLAEGASILFDCGERTNYYNIPVLIKHTSSGYEIYKGVNVGNMNELLGTSSSPIIDFKYTFTKDTSIQMKAEVAGYSFEKTSGATDAEIYWNVYETTGSSGTFAKLSNYRIYSEVK